MSKQLYEVGDVIQAGSNPLEVTGVSYREEDGEKVKFSYHVRLHSELEAEREEARKVEAAQDEKAQEVTDKENAKLTPVAQSDDEPVEHNEGAED